jgi:hypothetical protein
MLSKETKARIAKNTARRIRWRNRQWREWDKALRSWSRRAFRRVLPTVRHGGDIVVQPLTPPLAFKPLPHQRVFLENLHQQSEESDVPTPNSLFREAMKGGFKRGELMIVGTPRISERKVDMTELYAKLRHEVMTRRSPNPMMVSKTIEPGVDYVIGFDPGTLHGDRAVEVRMLKTRTGKGPSDFKIDLESTRFVDIDSYCDFTEDNNAHQESTGQNPKQPAA